MEELEDVFEHWGLKKIFSKVKDLSRPTVDIDLRKQRGIASEISRSRIGGSPAMRSSDEWPVDYNGTPQLFVGQINLEEASKYDETNMLPKKGLLLFFYSQDLEFYGSVAENSKQFKVIFYENIDDLELRDSPADVDVCDVQYGMSFSKIDTFPSWQSTEIEALEMDEEEVDNYSDCTRNYNHQMLGYACELQNLMEWECALALAGYSPDSARSEDKEVRDALAKEKDWVLLCQFLASKDAMPWGDEGELYFWITKQDLASKNFDSVWCVMQFT